MKTINKTPISSIFSGFTLLEISIVLVIIGLIAGGILAGKDLIYSAEIRSQISQIQEFNLAANTFQMKYSYLPGDLPYTEAVGAGFTTPMNPGSSSTPGLRNGDGIIFNYDFENQHAPNSSTMVSGETLWFWQDLSTNTGLIKGHFDYDVINNNGYNGAMVGEAKNQNNVSISDLLPRGKLNNTYVAVYSDKYGANYFSLVSTIGLLSNGEIIGGSGLPVNQAYLIDSKMDDGLPQSGKVTAQYQQWSIALADGSISSNFGIVWASGGGVQGTVNTSATPASSTTCYDNSNVAGAIQKYSTAQNGGSNKNCGISIKFQ